MKYSVAIMVAVDDQLPGEEATRLLAVGLTHFGDFLHDISGGGIQVEGAGAQETAVPPLRIVQDGEEVERTPFTFNQDDVRPVVPSPHGPILGPSTNMLRDAKEEHPDDDTLKAAGIESVESRAARAAAGDLLDPFPAAPSGEGQGSVGDGVSE